MSSDDKIKKLAILVKLVGESVRSGEGEKIRREKIKKEIRAGSSGGK